MSAPRLFFALWPDLATAGRFEQAAAWSATTAGRRPALADLHVTLCFLGAVDETAVPALSARTAAIDAAEFELEFDALEYWRRSRVLAATCSRTPPAADALAQSLRAAARSVGLTPDERPLLPHVSLLRALGPAAAPRQPPQLAATLRLAAQRFYLAQSQELPQTSAGGAAPARYRRLAEWPLRQPCA
ncbi:MAG TPA: RNA 2',3'-cyclic phosphodiesterase [Steroidobacteraceae bacterium]